MSPRTESQFVEIREASIVRILDASLELFADHGYEATSMSQIAQKAGVSKGLIYNYFDSKLDLLKGMIKRLNEGESELIAQVVDEDPRIMLRKIFEAFFIEITERTEIWKMIASISMQVDKFDFVHRMTVKKLDQFFELFKNLLTQIGYPNPAQEAKLIAALFDGIGFHYLIAREDYPIEEVKMFLIQKYCKA